MEDRATQNVNTFMRAYNDTQTQPPNIYLIKMYNTLLLFNVIIEMKYTAIKTIIRWRIFNKAYKIPITCKQYIMLTNIFNSPEIRKEEQALKNLTVYVWQYSVWD
jgi:hypothetical protein